MSFSDALNKANQTPAAPTAGAKKGDAVSEAFKKSGEAIRATLTDEQKAAEGSKSDKVAFLAVIADPAVKQDRQSKGNAVPSKMVIGYQLKLLEDATVPFAPQLSTKYDDVQAPVEQAHKAGEVINLNIVETAMLISRPEYAGRFTGEGHPVRLSLAISGSNEYPRPVLKNVDGASSIKESMVMAADMIDDGTGRQRPQVKPEFADKFGGYYTSKTTKKTSTVKPVKNEGEKNLAAAFRAMYQKKFNA